MDNLNNNRLLSFKEKWGLSSVRKSCHHRDRYHVECDIFRVLLIQRHWPLLKKKKWAGWFRASRSRVESWESKLQREKDRIKSGGEVVMEDRDVFCWSQPGYSASIQPGQTLVTAGCTAAYLAIKLSQWPASLPSNSPMSGIRISPTRVTSETQKAASSSFICLHNAAKDSGLHRGGAALLTCPAAPLRPSGLAVKRPLEKNCGWNTLACLCPVCLLGWGALTLALCQLGPVKPLNKNHSSVVLYVPNGWHSSSRVVL